MIGMDTAQAGQLRFKPGENAVRARSGAASLLRFIRSKPLSAFSALILAIFIVVAAFAPLIAPYDPLSNNSAVEMQGPTVHHLFGTDQFGRDVLSRINFGAAILAEAALAFLGYSVPPPTPSWGTMLSAEGRAYMFVGPWLLIAPTAVLTAVVFAINMFGDALRDVLDPRLRSTGGGQY